MAGVDTRVGESGGRCGEPGQAAGPGGAPFARGVWQELPGSASDRDDKQGGEK